MNQHDDIRNRSLRALAYELKQPLIRIARQAELGDPAELIQIQQTAEQSLRLIDSYLLSAQTEYGQIALSLEPASTGSVLYEAWRQLRPQAEARGISLLVDNRSHEPIMTNQAAIASILNACGMAMIGIEYKNSPPEVTLRSYKSRSGAIGVGLFSEAALTLTDLRQAFELQGRAHMPLARLHSSAHASLAIAGELCRAIGGTLAVKRMGSLSGFATELPRSEQLSLV